MPKLNGEQQTWNLPTLWNMTLLYFFYNSVLVHLIHPTYEILSSCHLYLNQSIYTYTISVFLVISCWSKALGIWTEASGLGLISSMRLNGRKAMQSIKQAWPILHSVLQTLILHLLKGTNKVCKTHLDLLGCLPI